MLDYKYKDITAKYQDESITSSTYRIYSCHSAGSAQFYFTKALGGTMGLRRVEVDGTLIELSSFYL